MNIDEKKFIAYLETKKYTPSYINAIINFMSDNLEHVSNDEILECEDYIILVERMLHKRYCYKDSRCKMCRVTLSRVADYLRMEAAV